MLIFRYSDFETLRNEIKKRFPYMILRLLPEKNFLTKFNQHDSDFDLKRRKELLDFLQRLCLNNALYEHPVIESFLFDEKFIIKDEVENKTTPVENNSKWGSFVSIIRKSVRTKAAFEAMHPDSAEIFEFRNKILGKKSEVKSAIKALKHILEMKEKSYKNLSEYILVIQQLSSKILEKNPEKTTFASEVFCHFSFPHLKKIHNAEIEKISLIVLEMKVVSKIRIKHRLSIKRLKLFWKLLILIVNNLMT